MSLKIRDYKNNKATQTKEAIKESREIQTLALEAPTTILMNECSPVLIDNLEKLGSSLDLKISQLVQVLSTLQGNTRSVSIISKVIHELTEDTRMVAQIKTELENGNTLPEITNSGGVPTRGLKT